MVSDIYLCSSVGSVQELKAKCPGFESQSDLFFVLFFSFVVYHVTIKLRKYIYYQLIIFISKMQESLNTALNTIIVKKV